MVCISTGPVNLAVVHVFKASAATRSATLMRPPTWARRELFRPSGVILHAMRRRLLATVLVLSAFAIPAFAAITGSVMTAEGAPVAGARVSIYGPELPDAR